MNIRLAATIVVCAICVHAAQPVKTSLAANVPGCQGTRKVTVIFKVEKTADFTPNVQNRLVDIWKWFDAASRIDPERLFSFSAQALDHALQTIPVRHVEIIGQAPEDWIPDPRHPGAAFRPPPELKVCVYLQSALPGGSLNAKLDFSSPANISIPPRPADLSDSVTNSSLAGPQLPGTVSPSTAAAKSFARELDLSGVLLSSVLDTTTKGVTVRSRTTKVTGDLFVAPILRLRSLSYHDVGSSLITYFTPFAVEAHASNQPITKDTLSQNRIVAGPEYEFRWYARNRQEGIAGNLFRLILAAKSASDRDFKLIEPKFTAEFRPIWERANQPVVDPKSLKDTGRRRTTGQKIGRTLSPFVGFEEGRSYLRGIPATAETPLGRFTRGYLGGDLGVDFNGHVSLATTQTMYVRGEVHDDWVHYMKSSGQWTFFSTTGLATALYVSFEKGRVPPFRSSTNAVTLGMRVQSSNWKLGGPR